MKTIIDLLINVVVNIFELLKRVVSWLFERFVEMNIFDKGIVLSTIPAFLAVVLPVARYYMFENYMYINNPMAVSMIGIVIIMFITFIFKGPITLLVRCSLNTVFFIFSLYVLIAHEISKAPYTVLPVYFLNLAVPVLFVIFSISSFLVYDN